MEDLKRNSQKDSGLTAISVEASLGLLTSRPRSSKSLDTLAADSRGTPPLLWQTSSLHLHLLNIAMGASQPWRGILLWAWILRQMWCSNELFFMPEYEKSPWKYETTPAPCTRLLKEPRRMGRVRLLACRRHLHDNAAKNRKQQRRRIGC